MPSPGRACLLLVVLLLACGLNLICMRWGMNRPETAILTFNTDWYFALGMQDAEQVGLYSSPFMDKKPWLSLGFGLILPLLLLGVAGYILVRPRKASSEF